MREKTGPFWPPPPSLHEKILLRHTENEVITVSHKKKAPLKSMDNLRLDPQQRLCAKFDSVSVAKFPVAPRDKMGVRVVDNCPEEHIQ
jgi:hypothetical protein